MVLLYKYYVDIFCRIIGVALKAKFMLASLMKLVIHPNIGLIYVNIAHKFFLQKISAFQIVTFSNFILEFRMICLGYQLWVAIVIIIFHSSFLIFLLRGDSTFRKISIKFFYFVIIIMVELVVNICTSV